MKITNPTVDQILDNFFNHGNCSLLLKNGRIILGIFTGQHRADHKIIGWYFNLLPEKKDEIILHSDIQEAENRIM